LQALKKSSIQFITTRHEQGAAFMADVYGRLTGKAGVCLSTLGPGATNLMTGVADATLDRAPLVAITGQVGTDRMHIESHQYLDLVAMFAPVTKWNAQIVRPSITPEIVRKAFKLAQTEKPGAVHIDLPENIAEMEVRVSPCGGTARKKPMLRCRAFSRRRSPFPGDKPHDFGGQWGDSGPGQRSPDRVCRPVKPAGGQYLHGQRGDSLSPIPWPCGPWGCNSGTTSVVPWSEPI
jgi:hypothetical protein